MGNERKRKEKEKEKVDDVASAESGMEICFAFVGIPNDKYKNPE